MCTLIYIQSIAADETIPTQIQLQRLKRFTRNGEFLMSFLQFRLV